MFSTMFHTNRLIYKVDFRSFCPFYLSALHCTRNYSTISRKFTLSLDTMNENIKNMKYAVRGEMAIRGSEIEHEMAQGKKKPFSKIIRANIGNCHAMGEKPITFIRQVLCLTTYPQLLESDIFPSDVKERANLILDNCSGRSIGSYTHSTGKVIIRKHISEYIQQRDGGIPSDPENIFLFNGGSSGIKDFFHVMACDVGGKTSGVMLPLPQYPLYSATLTEFGFHQIGYYLNEANNWSVDYVELQKTIHEARKVSHPRAIVIINPGNPTGQVLSKENIQQIIKFAYEEKLFIIADEVYQHNVYCKGCAFHSFKKVLCEMKEPYNTVELASFMSSSKGYMGECGLRGGYLELHNICPHVRKQFQKFLSVSLCSSVPGQICLDTIVKPPQKGEPSYDLFEKEKSKVLESFKRRAQMSYEAFNKIDGYVCNEIQGALYAFPRITIPENAVKVAKRANVDPNLFYTLQLLEKTGICVVPGSGFGQQPGSYHFRSTILPQEAELKVMLSNIAKFHREFVLEYIKCKNCHR